jgi:hypothetical protein
MKRPALPCAVAGFFMRAVGRCKDTLIILPVALNLPDFSMRRKGDTTLRVRYT